VNREFFMVFPSRPPFNRGLPDVRFHDLRHGAAVLLAAKVDLKVVSGLLGHSSVAITADIYAHVLPEMQQEAVRKMDDLFGRS
jgi:integrase